MTIEEFRGEGDAPIINRPNIHVDEEAKEQVAATKASNGTKERRLMQNIQDSNASNDQLKLKRTKPLKRTESALEKSLNLKRTR
jgi:hypothetical protein